MKNFNEEVLEQLAAIRIELLNQGSAIQEIKNTTVKKKFIRKPTVKIYKDQELHIYIIPLTYLSAANFVTNKEIFKKMAHKLNVNNIPALSKILVANGYLPGKRYVDGWRHRGFYLKFTPILESEINRPD